MYMIWGLCLIVNNYVKCLLVYLMIWTISILSFWIFSIDNAMGYSVVVFYIIIPIVTFVLSICMGKENGNFKYIVPVLFGIMYMLAEYLTFSLDNMITFNKVNLPDFSMIIIGMVISYIGVFINSFKKHIG